MHYGFLIALGVWISGFLLSGTFAYVEIFELYYTGELVLAFPFVFAVVSVIVAIFSRKYNNRSLYISFIVSFFIPVVCFLISGLLVQYADLRTNNVAIIINFMVQIPSIPANNVFLPMYECFGTPTIYLINIIPTVISFFISFVILKRKNKKE